VYAKHIQWLFTCRGSAFTAAAPPRFLDAWLATDKVGTLFRDVQERCRACPESGGEFDAVVTNVLNGDIPAERTRKRNGDVSTVRIYVDDETRTWSTPFVGAMLFCACQHFPFLILIERRGGFELGVPLLPERIQIDW
jgi:hypothetical protein